MKNDPIVKEIHKIREELAKKYNYDLNTIVKESQKRETKRNVPVIDRSKKTEISKLTS